MSPRRKIAPQSRRFGTRRSLVENAVAMVLMDQHENTTRTSAGMTLNARPTCAPWEGLNCPMTAKTKSPTRSAKTAALQNEERVT